MKALSKSITGVAVAAMVAVGMAAPAEARHRRHHHRDNVDVGDVVAGAVVIGGLIAVANAIGNSSGRGGGSERAAVEACSREAEQSGSYGGGRVSRITNVNRRDGYFHVRGELETNAYDRRYEDRDDGRYERRDDDRYGNDDGRYEERYDRERTAFTCVARGSRVYEFRVNDGYAWR